MRPGTLRGQNYKQFEEIVSLFSLQKVYCCVLLCIVVQSEDLDPGGSRFVRPGTLGGQD